MGFCKDCINFEKGFDGKPGICTANKIADLWNGYGNLEDNGVGYIDENYDKEFSVLFVGDYFGCNKFINKTI